MFEKKNVLVIEWRKCPDKIKDIVRDRERFQNDCYLKHHTELEPFGDDQKWSDTMTIASIESYYEDQKSTNDYTGTFEQFIEDYGLVIDKWLIDEKVDLTDVEEILFEISW